MNRSPVHNKNSTNSGVSCVGLLELFGPKGALGFQKHVEEVSEEGNDFDDLARE